MRIKLELELGDIYVPKDYKRGVISYFKEAIQNFDKAWYQELYNKEDPVIKPYTFSVFLPIESHEKERFVLKRKQVEITVSTGCQFTGMRLYNAFIDQKKKAFPFFKTSMTLKRVKQLREPSTFLSPLQVKFLTPLCIREHSRENNQDTYHIANTQMAWSNLRDIVEAQVKELAPQLKEHLETFQIMPVRARGTVVKHYNRYIDVNIGTYALAGHSELLQFLYEYGMGSHRSAGFGLFEIVGRLT